MLPLPRKTLRSMCVAGLVVALSLPAWAQPATSKRTRLDEAVSLGAAIQAGVIMQEKGLTKLSPAAASVMAATVSRDVARHAFGTVAVEESHGVERKRNSIIIPKDTRVPAERTETYYTM